MYFLTKYDFKIMRYLYCHKRSDISRAKLLRRFKGAQDNIDRLTSLDYISHDYDFPTDPSGFAIGDIPGSAIYHIENHGIAEVESHRYLTLENILRDLVVPIIVGVLSALITHLLIGCF